MQFFIQNNLKKFSKIYGKRLHKKKYFVKFSKCLPDFELPTPKNSILSKIGSL